MPEMLSAVIASAAKQSISQLVEIWIASSLSLLAMTIEKWRRLLKQRLIGPAPFHVKQILKQSPSTSSAGLRDADRPPGFQAPPASGRRADPPVPLSAVAQPQAWNAPRWKGQVHRRS